MIDLDEEYIVENALILLKSIWYSELPPIINFDKFKFTIISALENIQNKESDSYELDNEKFIEKFKQVDRPKYIRKNGVEPITYFDFKINTSLREMQIPNLKYYIAFIYNTLYMYEDIFYDLYVNEDNHTIVENSNSYLMHEETFEITSGYDDETFEIEAGVFVEKNNKATSSAMMSQNRKSYYEKQDCFLYKMKMDLESFFPNLYTHYFHRIYEKAPFSSLNYPEKYFKFLDEFHQRINDNQTKGVPAGVFSSHVAAELCMLCVDHKIKEYIKDKSITYIRYVDDFSFFSNSRELLDDLKSQVQQILNEFRLRINGNKTEVIPCVLDTPSTNLEDIKQTINWLFPHPRKVLFNDSSFLQLKTYISNLLKEKRFSQVKTCLSLLSKRIEGERIDFISAEKDCVLYLLQLSQTYPMVASKAYNVIDCIIFRSNDKNVHLDKLKEISDEIDLKYSNTILQIWHYYIIAKYSDEAYINQLISRLNNSNNNPIILSSFVKEGKKANNKLFNYIIDEYTRLSGANNWKSEIMYSKLWLPMFVINTLDNNDYQHWFNSNAYPDILKFFKA